MNYKKILLSVFMLGTIFSANCTTIYPQDTSTTLENSVSGDIIFDKEDPLLLNAKSAVLMDAKTGLVLYDKDPHAKLYPASITKIMTTLLAIEYGGANDVITHSHEAVYGIGYGSSHIGMREGEQISMKDALLGIMLPSANDVSVAMAEHIDGSIDAFAAHMTKRAKELGALDTNFVNPHGFHDENHYTTAYDMAMIAKEAIKHQEFRDLIATKNHTIPPTNIVNEPRVINNSNKLIQPWSPYYYPDCIGGKTGFTDQAGHNLVSFAKRGDTTLIAVSMHGDTNKPYEDAKKMFEYGFGCYESHKLFSTTGYQATIDITQHYKDQVIPLGTANVIAETDFTASVPYFVTDKTIEKVVTLPKSMDAPVSFGSVVGKLEFKYNGTLMGQVNLISKDAISPIDESTLARDELIKKIQKKAIMILKICVVIVILVVFCVAFVIFKYNVFQKVKLKKLYELRNRTYTPRRKKKGKQEDSEPDMIEDPFGMDTFDSDDDTP